MPQTLTKHSRAFSAFSLSILFLLGVCSPWLLPKVKANGTPINLTTIGVAYTQNFDSLANSGTSSTVPTGWGFSESGSSADSTYGTSTGSSATGNTYSFGATASSERAFGGLQSTSLIPTIGACFTNNTGTTVTTLKISYTGEQWRLGATGRADRLDFQYSLNASSLTTGTWTDVDTLDFSGPITSGSTGALDGNAAANRTMIMSSIGGLSLAPGATVFIRWNSVDATGSDDGLAVDDFSLTPQITPGAAVSGDATICPGGMTTIQATLTGTAPWNLAWSDGVMQNGVMTSTATRTVNPAVTTTYTVTAISDAVFAAGASSGSATVTLASAPTIVTDPVAQIVPVGVAASFTAAANGTAPLNVQWQESLDNGGTWANIVGATTATLSLMTTTLADNGKLYRAQFSNTCGTTNSKPALLNVLPVTVQILDPIDCVGDGTTLNVHAEIRNTSGVVVNAIFRAQLEAGLVTRTSSCNVPGGTCTFTGSDRVRWSGAILPGQTVPIDYQVVVEPGVVTGTDLCINSTVEINGGTVATVRACTRVNCPIIPGPGQMPTDAPMSDNKPGSVLFFNFYSSDVARPHLENTRFNITNTDGARTVTLHLFFVNSDDCRVADLYMCLTANQTVSFLASEYDPGMRGFLVVVAVDNQRGCPINFNYLIGSEHFKLTSGHAASLGAVAIAATRRGPMACDPGDSTARLDFDGTDYDRVPRALAVNSIQSPLDGNSTLLILNRVGGNFSTGTATQLNDLLGLLYDDQEKGYSFSFDPSGCQYVSRIFDGAPRTSPSLTRVIPRGRTGWLRLQHVTDSAMLGAVVNLNATGFNQGHNLHVLTYTDASITIPIFPPSCVQ